jgi:hypothetical protein
MSVGPQPKKAEQTEETRTTQPETPQEVEGESPRDDEESAAAEQRPPADS